MELIDALEHLKRAGYPVKFDHRRKRLFVGSWKKFYRVLVTKHPVDNRFSRKAEQGVFITMLMTGFNLSILYSVVWQKAIESLLQFSCALLIVLTIGILIFRCIKEHKIKKELDQLLNHLSLTETKENVETSSNL